MKKLFIPFAFVATFGLFAFANSTDADAPVTKFMDEAYAENVVYSAAGTSILTKGCWFTKCDSDPEPEEPAEDVNEVLQKY